MRKLDCKAHTAEVLEPIQQHGQPTAAGGVGQTLTWVGLHVGPEQVLPL